VIGDPEKRAKYDKYGERWRQAEQFDQAGGGFGGFGGGAGGFDFSQFTGGGGFSSFFEELFGGGHTASPFSSRDTEANVTIDMYTALLGGDIMVTTGMGSRLKLKVKPETQPGTKVRLRGKGRNGTDLILTYQVKLPTNLTERQRQLLQEMRQG
jgi:curved DNA-binding protein